MRKDARKRCSPCARVFNVQIGRFWTSIINILCFLTEVVLQVFYCSRECQLADWSDHKHKCRSPLLREQMLPSQLAMLEAARKRAGSTLDIPQDMIKDDPVMKRYWETTTKCLREGVPFPPEIQQFTNNLHKQSLRLKKGEISWEQFRKERNTELGGKWEKEITAN